MAIRTGCVFFLGLCLAGSAMADESKPKQAPVVAEVPEAQPYDAGTVRFLLTSEQTDGRSAVVELIEKPGYLTPPHRHDPMDETFYVIEGVLRVTMDGKTVDHPAGSVVFIPHGTEHAQGSGSDQPVRVIITMSPGGFESFFAGRVELAKHTKRGEPAFDEGMMKLLRENSHWIQHDTPKTTEAE